MAICKPFLPLWIKIIVICSVTLQCCYSYVGYRPTRPVGVWLHDCEWCNWMMRQKAVVTYCKHLVTKKQSVCPRSGIETLTFRMQPKQIVSEFCHGSLLHKSREISWLAEWLLSSQEGLCSMGLEDYHCVYERCIKHFFNVTRRLTYSTAFMFLKFVQVGKRVK
jgi:hypothetical protein